MTDIDSRTLRESVVKDEFVGGLRNSGRLTDIDKLARGIARGVGGGTEGLAFKAARLGILEGMKLQQERDAVIADDHSKRWGKRWQSGGGYDKKDDQDQHWRLAGFSDGAAVVAKAIRSAL